MIFSTRYLLVTGCLLVSSASAQAAEFEVRMAGMNFQPATLQAQVGDLVRFINDDGANHEMLIPTKGFGSDLGMQKPTEVAELLLRKAGRFEVECVVHPHMVMTIMVKE